MVKRKLRRKFFSSKNHGGKTKALAAAREFRNLVFSRMSKARQARASAPRRKAPKSGVVGVTHQIGKFKLKDGTYKLAPCWVATWRDSAGKIRTAKFSIRKWGEKDALAMAKASLKGGNK